MATRRGANGHEQFLAAAMLLLPGSGVGPGLDGENVGNNENDQYEERLRAGRGVVRARPTGVVEAGRGRGRGPARLRRGMSGTTCRGCGSGRWGPESAPATPRKDPSAASMESL
ncbi:uncharacterized protein PG986_004643 [Apiospora aurea]|uniref:Uncharacterized protein n=1 Tax=Apiospora aurea TaxID=335848 RepID=A0ABR1QN76_9PEZI